MAQACVSHATQACNPVLSIVKGHPRASSAKIAEHFGKAHRNVTRAIESLDIPDDWRALNFEHTSFEVPMPNGGTRTESAILMTRDGFTLVVMGFTGKKALEWKLRYIDAFNKMEGELSGRQSAPLPLTPSTIDDRKPLDAGARVGHGGGTELQNSPWTVHTPVSRDFFLCLRLPALTAFLPGVN